MFELSIRLGDIMVFLGLVGTGVSMAYKIGIFTKTVQGMQEEIVELKEVGKTVASVLTTVAVQKVELENIRQDISELKHGEGFVMPLLKPK